MAQLQPFVPNVPLQVAANLRFKDANGIPVTQMLPIGMNGLVVNDSPTTGYISRIGAVLSQQIDLYNQVSQTLQNYGTNISDLQEAVAALELSGTTIPIVNGHCFTGNANSPITTVVDLMAQSACDYNAVLGTPSALTEAIIAEGAAALNILAAFSQNSDMAGLPGWISLPETIADSITNLWLSYLDSRSGVSKALAAVVPTCSQVIIDYSAIYKTAVGNGSGFFVYFSGYSFIPSGYTDNGSTITITDGLGGLYTSGLNIVNWSNAGTDALFVGISGTNLSPNAQTYRVQVNAMVKNGGNSCTKVVIHDINGSNDISGSTATCCPDIGNKTVDLSPGTTQVPIVSGLTYSPRAVVLIPKNAYTSRLIAVGGANFQMNANVQPYMVYNASGAVLTFDVATADSGTFNADWVAYK
jgi:hypothetical protein